MVSNKNVVSKSPAPRYYFGEYAGSEKETQVVMDYINKYSYNLLIDYHSQGEIVFWGMWTMPEEYVNYNKKIANLVQTVNGYKPYINYSDEHGSGYITDYFASVQYAPAITIETTKARSLPYVSNSMRNDVFNKNKNTTKELVLYNELNIPNGLGDTTLYTSDGKFYGNYPLELIKGYKERYNLFEKNELSKVSLAILENKKFENMDESKYITLYTSEGKIYNSYLIEDLSIYKERYKKLHNLFEKNELPEKLSILHQLFLIGIAR